MQEKMKVALFMHDFAGGGVEKMRLALAAALVCAQCEVSIVVVRASGPLLTHVPPGVEVFDLQSRRLLWAIPGLIRHIRALRPHVLMSSLDHNNIAALCACGLSGTRTRLVICQHNALSQEVRLGWKYRVIPVLYRLFAGRADAIVAVSRGVADDLTSTAHLPRRAIEVISNPVVESGALRPVGPSPHPWFTNTEIPVFVFVGRLVAQKDPLTLLAAFACHASRHAARLVVLGDGPLREEMVCAAAQAGVAEYVHFAGFVHDPRAWIAHAHALVLTSRYEGFANVIVEALACGTPVIATDCPYGPAEILADGRYGILVKVGDANALAASMACDIRARFSASDLHARAMDFTVQKAAASYLALFNRWPQEISRAFGLAFTQRRAEDIAARLVSQSAQATRLVVTPNLDHVRLLGARGDFRQACLSADTVCADGWPVAFYAFARGAAPARRATGCDILHALLSRQALASRRVFAVVESAATAAALTSWLRARNLSAQWAMEVAPRNLAEDLAAQRLISERVCAFEPHILIMTLGAPVSEVFVHQNHLPKCWAICVGQALRVELGLTRRAPIVWRQLGLEWAWRCTQEPARLGTRYFRALAWFPWAIVLDLWRGAAEGTTHHECQNGSVPHNSRAPTISQLGTEPSQSSTGRPRASSSNGPLAPEACADGAKSVGSRNAAARALSVSWPS